MVGHHPARQRLADVVVVPLPHTTKGEAPVAAVVCHAGRELSTQQVQGSTWDPDSIMEYEFEAGLIDEPDQYDINGYH